MYLLTLGGRNRGLARRAFAGVIPESIRTRMTKGNAASFFADAVASQSGQLIEALSYGELARAKLIRSDNVKAFLDPSTVRYHANSQVALSYYTLEAWLTTWEKLRHERSPGPSA